MTRFLSTVDSFLGALGERKREVARQGTADFVMKMADLHLGWKIKIQTD